MKAGGKDRKRGKPPVPASPQAANSFRSWILLAAAIVLVAVAHLLISQTDAGGAGKAALLGPLLLLSGYVLAGFAAVSGAFR